MIERLKEIRSLSGLTQNEFAEKMGISLTTQKSYERGASSPTTLYLQKIAEAGFDVIYLLTGERQADTLSAEDSEVLRLWHAAPLLLRNAALNVLLNHEASLLQNTQHNRSDHNVQNIGNNNDNRQVNKVTNPKAEKVSNNDFRKAKIKHFNQ